MSVIQDKEPTRQRVQVEVVKINKKGGAVAKITHATLPVCPGTSTSATTTVTEAGLKAIARQGEYVTIPKGYHVKEGYKATCMLVPNNTNKAEHKWLATYFVLTTERSRRKWLPWQDGENALALTLPSTKPGSSHVGLFFGCWKCGRDIVHPYEIYCIKNTSVWTKRICSRNGPVVDDSENEELLAGGVVEKSCIQTVRCQCKNILGRYYRTWYGKSGDGGTPSHGFPCYKLETVRERWNWADADRPSMAMVLLGSREDVEKSIANLTVLKETEVDSRHQQLEGRKDQATQTETTTQQAEGLRDQATQTEMAKVFEAKPTTETAAKRTRTCEVAQATQDWLSSLESLAVGNEIMHPSGKEAKDKQNEKATPKFKGPILNRIIWECKVTGSWLHYPSDISDKLESAYAKGTIASFSIQGKNYYINFGSSTFVQRNITTNTIREVRRREVRDVTSNSWVLYPSYSCHRTMEYDSRQSIKCEDEQFKNTELGCQTQAFYSPGNLRVPSTWTLSAPAPAGKNCELVKVVRSSQEWKDVEKQLVETVKFAKVHEILRVQNVLLWEYFCFRADRLVKLSGGKAPNIVNVWHGTRETNPKVICTDEADGFMMQHSRTGLWGNGIYFAERASLSHQYAFQSIDTDRCFFSIKKTVRRSMILVKLIAGDEVTLKPDSTLRHCPNIPGGNGKRYDTVTGKSKESKVYVVYENGRAYPEYLVTYAVR